MLKKFISYKFKLKKTTITHLSVKPKTLLRVKQDHAKHANPIGNFIFMPMSGSMSSW